MTSGARPRTTLHFAQTLDGRNVAERIAALDADAAPSSGATVRVLARESPIAYAACECPG